MESTNAVARMITMEKPANVSVVAIMHNYNMHFHNILHSGSVTLCNIVPFRLFTLVFVICLNLTCDTKHEFIFIFILCLTRLN